MCNRRIVFHVGRKLRWVILKGRKLWGIVFHIKSTIYYKVTLVHQVHHLTT
jgi:hypothetical protein